MAEPGTESSVLDYTGQGIRRIETIPNAWPTTLIYDRNAINKVENLDQYKDCLQQLSIAENQLTRIGGLGRLTNLSMLNLPNNSISNIDGLKNLTHLTWLNLSGNCLKSVENLQHNVLLQHLDVSDNNINSLPEISPLHHLKSLLLHGNMLNSLETASSNLPGSLTILSLAENDIDDLNQVAFLSTFPGLEQLSIMNNPCVIMAGPHPGFDYRPFVVNWCLSLNFLDGYQISETERLRAEWLYSQGRGRHHRPGQHFALMQYLSTVCPLTAATDLESLEDQKLARILQHQRLHQASLEDEARSSQGQVYPVQGQSRKPHAPTHGESSKHLQESPKPGTPGGNRRSTHEDTTSRTPHVTCEEGGAPSQGLYNSPYKGQPVKAWGDQARGPPSVGPGPRLAAASEAERQMPSQADLQVQDISSSDDSHSLLECETRYIPLHTSEMLLSPTKPLHLGGAMPARPITAPPAGHHQQPAPSLDHERPASDMDVLTHDLDPASHKAALMNPPRRMAANFPPSSPKSLKPNQADLHLHAPGPARRRSTSPMARGAEITTDSDSETIPDGSATLELKLLKAILHNRKTKKAIRKSIHDQGSSASYSSIREGQSRQGSHPTDGEIRHSQADMEVEQVMSEQGDKRENLAATRLQATWRGYFTREKNPEVLRIRHEMRSRRSEDHITFLRSEVERQKLLYEQEKELRVLQLEAVKHLWREVQSLQQWKDEVLQSQDLASHTPPATNTLNDSTKHLIETLEKASINPGEVGMSSSGTPVHCASSARSSEKFSQPKESAHGPDTRHATPRSKKDVEKVESACKQLQQQVSELQQALTSVSNFVFQAGSSGDEGDGDGKPDPHGATRVFVANLVDTILVSTDINVGSPPVQPHPQPAEEGGQSQAGGSNPVLRAGLPTPPGSLHAALREEGSVLLQWNPSFIPDSQGQPSNKTLIGYRVYINDRPKGMVGGKQNKSLLEGLSPSQTYRVYLRAVSAMGESFDSNVVVIPPQAAADEIRLSQILPDQGDDGDSNSRSRHQDPNSQSDPSGRSGGQSSAQLPNPGPPVDGTGPTTRSAARETTGSRIPTLKNRSLLQGQTDHSDLESSKCSTLEVTKGSCGTLYSSSKDTTMLEMDSGYITTLGSLSQKDSRLSTKASVAPSIAIETVQEESTGRKGAVVEKLEQKLRGQKESMEGKVSPLSTQESKNVVNKLLDMDRPSTPSGSPRIQEGLIKRLEQSRDKSMLGELKFAAKIHKRRNESPTPLRAIPSELNRAEALAAEITGRRESDGAAAKAKTGVVVEAPERLPRSKDLDQGNSHVPKMKPEDKISQGQKDGEERSYSDPKIQGIAEEKRERRRGKALSEDAEEKLRSYFSRHESLRYRVKMPSKPRLRRNSGGEEQEEPEKDTPAVKSALEKYRENNRTYEIYEDGENNEAEQRIPLASAVEKNHGFPSEKKYSHLSSSPDTPERKHSGERKLSPRSEKKFSPSSSSPNTPERRYSGERKLSPRSEKKFSYSGSSPDTPERKHSGERKLSPRSKVPSPKSNPPERRLLPHTPESPSRVSRTSEGRSNASPKLDQTPPTVPPRSYNKSMKDSGLRARSPSPGKRRSERSRDASPAGTKSRTENSDSASAGEGFSRKGSLRQRLGSSGSDASNERSASSSPQKHSSDETSSSSLSKCTSDSRSESRSYSTRSEKSTTSESHRQRGESSSTCNKYQPSSGIPVPSSEVTDNNKVKHHCQAPEEPQCPEDMVRHGRGRQSAREARSNKKVEVGQRSSSLGAVVDRITGGCCSADTVIITDKPPMARREGSKENLQNHKSSRENITNKGSRENVSQKPPVSRTSSKEDVAGRRSTRRRTHSDHSTAGSSEDDDGSLPRSGSRESFSDRKSSGERSTGSGDMTEALQAALLTPAKTSPREKEPSGKKALLKHKRSNSDLSGIRALPDRPESPAPKEWKPSKPNQAPSSPRVIRSSSFSKLMPGDGSADNPEALVRQCISLETLKAAKSHDVSHFEAKRSSQSESPAQQESPPTTGLMFDKGAVVRRSLERCYNRGRSSSSGQPLPEGNSDHKARPHSMSSLDKRDEKSASDGATKARRASDRSFSAAHEDEYDEDVLDVVREMEKLQALPPQAITDDRTTRLEELRERRNKLGTKAADLFARLQQRLSANKT